MIGIGSHVKVIDKIDYEGYIGTITEKVGGKFKVVFVVGCPLCHYAW